MAKMIPHIFLFFYFFYFFNKNKRQQTDSRKSKLSETVSRETHVVFTCVEGEKLLHSFLETKRCVEHRTKLEKIKRN
jgi:hypothetical protein